MELTTELTFVVSMRALVEEFEESRTLSESRTEEYW